MKKRSSPNRVLPVMAVVPVLLLAACVKPGEPGVAVKALQADIVFGVSPPAEAPPPSVDPFIIEVEEGAPTEPPAPAPRRALTPRPAISPCIDARETAFPEVPAGTDVTEGPKVGQYRWKLGGASQVNGVRVPLGGFVNRRIENVSAITTASNRLSDPPNESQTKIFTFDHTLEADQIRVVVTYEVRSNPNQQVITSPAGTLQVGEPQRGISLAKVTTYDAAGKAVATFAPVPAVTLLPLQVFSGSQFQSVGVDPATGSTLVHQGTVGKRVPVDACGDMVDGWQVTSQQVFTSAAGASTAVSYTYTVAPQLGGMLIYEKTGPPANAPNAATANTLELILGQLNPSTT